MKSFRIFVKALFCLGFILLSAIPALGAAKSSSQILLKDKSYYHPVMAMRPFDIMYFSSNPRVVEISPNGVIKACHTGKADILTTSQEGLSFYHYEVIGIAPSTLSIKVGEKANFHIKTSSKAAAGPKGSWTSSAPSIASVDSYGKVTALVPGNATIAYTLADGQVLTSEVCVFSRVEQGLKDVYVKAGGRSRLHFPQFQDASPASLRWTSSADRIVSVLANGTITGEQAGTATIICSLGSRQYSCRVHVVSIEKEIILGAGDSCDIPLEGIGQETGGKHPSVTWKSENTTIASITERGASATLYAGTIAGSTKITATIDGQVLSCKVTVINLSDQVLFMQPQDKYKIRTEGIAAGSPVRWSSSNSSVASVDSSGVITAKRDGSAVITCKTSIKTKTSQYEGLSVIINVIGSTGGGNKWDFSFIKEDGNKRTYHLYKQNSHTYGNYSRYMSYHGCATCTLATILNGYSNTYADTDPAEVIEGIEKEVAGKEAWTKEHETKELKSQMPLSLYGISTILSEAGIPNTYVRKYRQASGKDDIIAHLKTGNPIIFEVRQKSNLTGQSSKRWTNSYHTMALLGIFTNGKVLVCDSVDRGWYKGGGQRLKITDLEDIMEYMYSCSANNRTIYYSGYRSDGGYIKVN